MVAIQDKRVRGRGNVGGRARGGNRGKGGRMGGKGRGEMVFGQLR